MNAHDRIKSLRMGMDSLATSAGTLDVGFHAAGIGGAAVNIDALGTAIISNSATEDVEIRYEILGHETLNQPVWQLAGVAADPGGGTFYDLTVTVLARGTTPATGNITLSMLYTAGD